MTKQNSIDRFQSFDPPRRFKPHAENVYSSPSFSPDGQLIATGHKCNIKLWQPDGTLIETLTGHTDDVYDTSFSPDGEILASGGADDTIKLWRRDGTLIKTLGTPYNDRYERAVTCIRFSPDGEIFVAGNVDSTMKLWSRDGTSIEVFGQPEADYSFNPINSLSFNPDGQTFISGDRSGTIELWQRDGTLIATAIDNSKNGEVGAGLVGATFSPDGQTMAAGTMYGTIELWQLDGTPIRTLGEPRKVLPGPLHHFSPHGRARISALSFSPDGNLLAVGFSKSEGFTQSNRIELWEPSGNLIETFEIPGIDSTTGISFSPDGKTIALSTMGGFGTIELQE
jgi:WD40 repeat protein